MRGGACGEYEGGGGGGGVVASGGHVSWCAGCAVRGLGARNACV